MSTVYNTNFAGQIDVHPRLIRIDTDQNFSAVTAAGFINSTAPSSETFYSSDIAMVAYNDDMVSNTANTGIFSLSFGAGGVITLLANDGNVVLPVVSGDFAIFNGTTGTIADLGYSPTNAAKTKVVMANGATTLNHIVVAADTAGTIKTDANPAINAGNIQAGLSGTGGSLFSFPATATNGSLAITAVNNPGNFITTISNAAQGQNSIYSIPDVGQATGSFQVSKTVSDPCSNLIAFDIVVGQAGLATGGAVTLVASSGSKQYKIRSIQLNGFGTNFSGGGGDRLGQVTDGTSVFSVIPAATMQALTNSAWGSTALPFPASVATDTSSAAGAAITFKYSGGTTDYTAGSLTISILVQRVA
jgi:uncharacterized protein (UPF0333 family)